MLFIISICNFFSLYV